MINLFFSQHKNFTKESLTPSSITHTPFRVPQGHAFTDLDGDFNAGKKHNLKPSIETENKLENGIYGPPQTRVKKR